MSDTWSVDGHMMIDEDLWASKDIDDAPHVCRYNEGREEKPNMGSGR